ncbi:hypothetical protein ADUPG1_008453, partial [Aduncisulcus paluster]
GGFSFVFKTARFLAILFLEERTFPPSIGRVMEHFNYLRAEQVTMLGLSLPEPCSGREMMERCVRRHREALDSLFPRLMLRPIYEQQCCFGQYLLFEGKSICDLFVSCPK